VSDTLIDSLVHGRYRIVRKLGAGGMATVYLAEDQELGRRVALKVLNERHAHDEQFVERFRREAQNAAGLSHPNIVSIFDRGETDDGTYYIAMEYLDGRTLKDLLRRRGPMPVRLALQYARQILAGMRFAHRHGIVHRDIKPHNVMVDNEGRLKVTDFGIARAGASQMTEAGSIVGTAQYLSPEQARGESVDPRSDIYSMGIVLYEMLTGGVPFTGETPVEIAMKHLSAVPEPPSAKRDDVPRDVDLATLRALAKSADDRYQSAEEMDAELARIEQGLGVSDDTAEAATSVLRGVGLEATMISGAQTMVAQRPQGLPQTQQTRRYYDYAEELPTVRRRSIWPWLLTLGALVVLGIGALYLYNAVQDQLNAAKPVAVPDVRGLLEPLAVEKILDEGLRVRVRRLPNGEVPVQRVYDQTPAPGERIDKQNTVTLLVSAGKPKARVPDVRGQNVEAATRTLEARGFDVNTVEVNSEKEPGTVLAQDPKPGTILVKGSTVRINVSKGPKPIEVPSVVGLAYDQARETLEAAGFTVARSDVDSEQPEGVVVDQSPGPGETGAKGSTVTISVSQGPSSVGVPDVTGSSETEARDALVAAGFKVTVQEVEVSDATQDGVVIFQDPVGSTEADPGSRVTIAVGRLAATPTEPAPVPTTSEPAETLPVP
jgi:beta-lactam-binding protein with PASTA domain